MFGKVWRLDFQMSDFPFFPLQHEPFFCLLRNYKMNMRHSQTNCVVGHGWDHRMKALLLLSPLHFQHSSRSDMPRSWASAAYYFWLHFIIRRKPLLCNSFTFTVLSSWDIDSCLSIATRSHNFFKTPSFSCNPVQFTSICMAVRCFLSAHRTHWVYCSIQPLRCKCSCKSTWAVKKVNGIEIRQ